MKNKSCLVVLSGGQDSVTCLAWAKQQYEVVHAVTFNYGQRHKIEIDSARAVCEILNVDSHEIIDIPEILKSASPLISENQLETYDNFEQMGEVIGNRVELTFVPMRNTLFLTIATNRAIELGCQHIITGVCQQDNANYPDCTNDFIHSLEKSFNKGLGISSLKIITPLMYHTKAQSVKLALTIPKAMLALAYSHTSYDGDYPPINRNHATVLREQGFLEADIPDPLIVRACFDNLMNIPPLPNYNEARKLLLFSKVTTTLQEILSKLYPKSC